jgi:hypothetical protein
VLARVANRHYLRTRGDDAFLRNAQYATGDRRDDADQPRQVLENCRALLIIKPDWYYAPIEAAEVDANQR